uniref:Putative ovule protein n=1 Tax=Solanum chacoense TaxID=4108 RepID=A0A0V0H5D5_SOLCH
MQYKRIFFSIFAHRSPLLLFFYLHNTFSEHALSHCSAQPLYNSQTKIGPSLTSLLAEFSTLEAEI